MVDFAHWKLANQPEARRFYDLGVQWMQKNAPNDQRDLARFRAEAEELLGVKTKEESKGKEQPEKAKRDL